MLLFRYAERRRRSGYSGLPIHQDGQRRERQIQGPASSGRERTDFNTTHCPGSVPKPQDDFRGWNSKSHNRDSERQGVEEELMSGARVLKNLFSHYLNVLSVVITFFFHPKCAVLYAAAMT
ncbi:Beta-2 adrenergic receptor [Dissostichus eleginoides]|uniref:Beta-2 adrenergic receptor n=1 Tax=Dissostichus eleginoides TaxID=100907 RepID=A0AAD9BDC2_DISEL|nr:Beta-2 adrenergic receptor [Dissostichus eleginoides]